MKTKLLAAFTLSILFVLVSFTPTSSPQVIAKPSATARDYCYKSGRGQAPCLCFCAWFAEEFAWDDQWGTGSPEDLFWDCVYHPGNADCWGPLEIASSSSSTPEERMRNMEKLRFKREDNKRDELRRPSRPLN